MGRIDFSIEKGLDKKNLSTTLMLKQMSFRLTEIHHNIWLGVNPS